jgi:hypothetical protein
MDFLSNLPCRTGCGKQVGYEHIQFPDGFIYFLPRNNDLTIHDCLNLPKIDDGGTGMPWSKEEQELEDYIDKVRFSPTVISKQQMEEVDKKIKSCPNQFNREYSEIESTYLNDHYWNREEDSIPLEAKKSESSFYERDLLNSQMRCILFPSPFFFTPNLTKIPDVVWLSKCYKNLGNYECAIIALMIQDKITHDQGNEILKLEKLKKDFSQQNKIKVDKSIIQIRDNDIRNVEENIKKFIRTNLSIEGFKKVNFQLFNELEKHREERNNVRTATLGKFDDVFERLTLGQCIMLINNLRKSKDFFIFNQIKREHIHRLEWLKENFRNENDHAVGDVEREFTEEDKILAVTYCKTITDHINKLQLV